MLHLFRNRGERQALTQLAASLPQTHTDGGRTAPRWTDVQREWTSRELHATAREGRIAELERELENARLMLAEADANARASETRFDLVNRASSEGLWDMEVVAGDPVNPRNFAKCWGFATSAIFPMSWPAGLIACTRKTRPPRWTPLPAT